jgi:UrcA family protein
MTRSAFAPTFALAAMLVLGAAQAHADTVVVLHTNSLNMAKPADVELLAKRIRTAAMDVCGAPIGSSRAMIDEVKDSSCYRNAVTTAIASMPSATKLAAR